MVWSPFFPSGQANFYSLCYHGMDQKRCRQSSSSLMLFFVPFFCLLLLCLSGSAHAYKNFTVGDTLGWYDNLQKPNANYQKWAASKSFSLGDFLIFNTNTNHSVIRSYNSTTYKNCDYDDALDSDTTELLAGDPSADPKLVTVPVQLVREGMTYFFSSPYEGEQCRNGQRFSINVTHGQGLPAGLKSPVVAAPGPTTSSDDGDEESAPDTVVSSNFNHPKNSSSDVAKESGSVSLSMSGMSPLMNGVFIALGFACVLLF